MITQEILGQRLRLARLNVGLSQEAVAGELQVPRPTISQIESGKRGVSGLELAQLARLYGRPIASFLDATSAEALQDDPLTLLFSAADLQPQDRQVVAEFEALSRAFGDIEALLELEGESFPPDYSAVGEPRNRREAIRQGEQIATEERRRLDIGDDPIRDVFELLEGQGVRLFVRPLQESGISGLFLYSLGTGPCILINGAEPSSRLAFNAAHEYAHVLLDRKLGGRISAASRFLRDQDQQAELIEVRANSFAAAFLLPSAGLKRFLAERGMRRGDRRELDVIDVLYLHRAFGVSYQATLYRLQNLGWLARDRREALERHQPEILAQALGLAAESVAGTPAGSVLRYPPRYVYLALEAYKRAKISLGKLGELLGKSLAEARELVWTLDLETDDEPVLGAA